MKEGSKVVKHRPDLFYSFVAPEKKTFISGRPPGSLLTSEPYIATTEGKGHLSHT